jgi:hypothetical protein
MRKLRYVKKKNWKKKREWVHTWQGKVEMTPIENKLKEEGLRDGKHPALTLWINYF